MLLSILVGSGTQLFLMIIFSMFFAAIGFLSPSSRGSLSTVMFMLYALFGFVGSYTSMGVYKFFHGPYWKANMILTPLLVPGFIFLCITALNLFLVFVHSSGAIPATTLLFIILLWFVFSIPSAPAGAFISSQEVRLGRPPHEDEPNCKTDPIPTMVSKNYSCCTYRWYLPIWVNCY